MKIVATSPASHATNESSVVTVLWCILPDVVCHIHLWYRLIWPGWPGQKAKLINPSFNDQFCCNEMTINVVKCRKMSHGIYKCRLSTNLPKNFGLFFRFDQADRQLTASVLDRWARWQVLASLYVSIEIWLMQVSFETLARGRGFSRFGLRRQLLMVDSLSAIVGPTILKEI